jgi:hypothetical protein
MVSSMEYEWVKSKVADLPHLNADLDSASHLNEDSDPTFHCNADLIRIRIQLSL